MTKLMTVQKWEKEFQTKWKWVTLPGSKVGNVQCIICKEYEAQIMSSENFSDSSVKGSKIQHLMLLRNMLHLKGINVLQILP